MDANTWAILEKVDKVKAEILAEFHLLRHEVQQLQNFKHRVMGMAFIVGLLGSASFEVAVLFFKH
jgi:hypothetical protein